VFLWVEVRRFIGGLQGSTGSGIDPRPGPDIAASSLLVQLECQKTQSTNRLQSDGVNPSVQTKFLSTLGCVC